MHLTLSRRQMLEQAFCILTCIYYTLKGWKFSSWILNLFLVFALVCGALTAIKNIYTRRKELLLITPFVLISIYQFCLQKDSRLIIALLAVFVGTRVSFENIAKWILKTKCIIFILALFIGGYVHPNYLSNNIGVILPLFMYVNYYKGWSSTLFIGGIIYIFGVFLSRSSSMIIIGGAILMLYLALNTRSGKRGLSSKWVIPIFLIVLLLNWGMSALYAAYAFSNPDYAFLKVFIPDRYTAQIMGVLSQWKIIFHGRIDLAAYSMGRFGYSVWGGNIDYSVDTGLPYFLVDSGMILLLQDWGLVVSVIIMILFLFMMNRFVIKREYRLIISAIAIALWAFNEDTLMSIGTNYLYFAIGEEIGELRSEQKANKCLHVENL